MSCPEDRGHGTLNREPVFSFFVQSSSRTSPRSGFATEGGRSGAPVPTSRNPPPSPAHTRGVCGNFRSGHVKSFRSSSTKKGRPSSSLCLSPCPTLPRRSPLPSWPGEGYRGGFHETGKCRFGTVGSDTSSSKITNSPFEVLGDWSPSPWG